MIDIAKITSRNIEYWNTIGAKKTFSDPVFVDRLLPHITTASKILEYGCGYGRLLNMLHEMGFNNLQGVDRSIGMVERAINEYPHLLIHHVHDYNTQLEGGVFDVVILSTVLCCNPDDDSIYNIVEELSRVLKPNGVLYFCDFLITDSDHFRAKYDAGAQQYHQYGVYRTNEGAIVRHFQKSAIMEIFREFHYVWSDEVHYFTMNNNPVSQFHGVFRK